MSMMDGLEKKMLATKAICKITEALLYVPSPVAILEGYKFVLTYANQALLSFWGKESSIIGKPLLEILPEIKDQPFPLILKNVLLTGKSYQEKEAKAILEIDGKAETVYCDYSYTAIKDDNGENIAVLVVANDVTEKVLANGRIGEGKQNLEFILEAGQLGYFELDLQTGTLEATAQYKANLGLNRETALNLELLYDMILPEYHDYIRNEEKKAFESGSDIKLSYKIRRADGQIRWLKVTSSIRNKTSGQRLVFGVSQDITDEMDALEKQARLAAIVESTDTTILSKTLQGIITSWNPAAEQTFGYTEQEAIGKHISLLIPEDRLAEEDAIISSISRGVRVDHFETKRKTKDGRLIDISLTISPIRDKNGLIIGASKIARDITEQRLAQEKQAMLAAIVDSTDDTILSKTLKGIITSWNPAAERMFGYSEKEAVGKHISILIPEDRLQEEDYIIGNISKGIRVEHFETVRKTKDGRLIDIALTISPIRNKNGEIIGASKIARNITEQKKNELRLKNYTSSLEIINQLCQSISGELDLDKLLQKVTDSATQATMANFGAFFYNTINEQGEAYTLYNVSGAPLEHFSRFGMPRNTAVFHPTFAGEGVVRVDDITKDSRYGKSTPHHGMPEGHLPVKSYLAVPVVSKTGTVVGGLFLGHGEPGRFNQDHENIIVAIASQAAIAIDNAKLFEEVRVLNSKKDEFIGLASHELKTPLTSMTAYLQILDRTPLKENQKGFLQKTIKQTQKISSLVNDILDVSKIVAGKLQFFIRPFNISQVVLDSIELIQLSASTHKISLKSAIKEIIIGGDRHRIEQVVINLLNNAIKYSPKADLVEVTITDSEQEVRIGVKDYGIGIPQDKIANVFSRFYRVDNINPNISGLGIGLYISKEIIERHRGQIWVESEEGHGSTFWFTLPKNTIHS